MAEQTLDLMKPGKVWAAAENFSKLTFHLVVPQAGYTKDALTKNPASIKADDQLMRPWEAPASAANGEGVIEFDLKARAEEITAKIGEKIGKGQKIDKARVVVIATAKEGNKVPEQQVAEISDFKVKPIPTIKLAHSFDKDPTRTYTTVPLFRDGAAAFVIAMKTTAVEEVAFAVAPRGEVYFLEMTGAAFSAQLKNNPNVAKQKQLQEQLKAAQKQRLTKEQQQAGYSAASPAWRNDMLANEANLRNQINEAALAQAKAAMGGKSPVKTAKVKDGVEYTLVVPVPFALRKESRTSRVRQPYITYYVNGRGWVTPTPENPLTEAQKANGWRSAGNGDFVNVTESRDQWDGGDFTLTVTGTGAASSVKDSVKLRAENWGADWLQAQPPMPFRHNHC